MCTRQAPHARLRLAQVATELVYSSQGLLRIKVLCFRMSHISPFFISLNNNHLIEYKEYLPTSMQKQKDTLVCTTFWTHSPKTWYHPSNQPHEFSTRSFCPTKQIFWGSCHIAWCWEITCSLVVPSGSTEGCYGSEDADGTVKKGFMTLAGTHHGPAPVETQA